MKREIPLLIVLVSGLVMVVQYFVPHEASQTLFTYANDFVIVIGIMSLPIGLYSLVRTTVRKARHEPGERFYSLITLAGFAIMVVTGWPESWSTWAPAWLRPHLSADAQGGLHRMLFTYVLTSAQASLFAMLAFYVASAAYRAFRVRTALAAVLLVTAFVVMLRILPLPEPLGSWNAAVVAWILAVPNLASKRAIIIGVSLGGVAYAIKILLGIERSYMGRE